MPAPRFYFSQPSIADKLLANADELKIHVMRVRGRLVMDFEVHGHVGEFHDEDDTGEPLPEPDTLGAVSDLLTLFAANVKGGGA